LPPNLKLKNGKRKYILKKAFSKLIPNKIINRKKKGFGSPISTWLLNQNLEFKNSKIFDIEKINKLKMEHIRKKKDNSRSLFGLLSLTKSLE
jgi:asparagine synthase (glutamine-hydrolysing)